MSKNYGMMLVRGKYPENRYREMIEKAITIVDKLDFVVTINDKEYPCDNQEKKIYDLLILMMQYGNVKLRVVDMNRIISSVEWSIEIACRETLYDFVFLPKEEPQIKFVGRVFGYALSKVI